MKRIIAVLPHFFGGGESVTNAIVNALRPNGFEFILIADTKHVSHRITELGKLYAQIIPMELAAAHYSLSTTQRVAETIRPLNADVLWLIGDDFSDIPLLRQSIKKGGKIIYHLHSIPFYQVRLKDSYQGKPNKPISYAKWYLFKHLKEKLFKSYDRRYKSRTKRTASDVDAFITLCPAYSSLLSSLYPDLASKFISIYNPVKPVAVTPCEKRKEVAYVGRLSFADKRVDNLLRIFAKVAPTHPDWKLRLIGDGPERQKLEQLVSELGIADKVDFTGYVDNPLQELASASILCLTSDIEGWGMALVEAMQTGAVPMAFNCSPGVAELLADGRGALIPAGDLDAYAAALADLMDNPDRRAAILATHPQFLATLDLQTIGSRWTTLFNS